MQVKDTFPKFILTPEGEIGELGTVYNDEFPSYRFHDIPYTRMGFMVRRVAEGDTLASLQTMKDKIMAYRTAYGHTYPIPGDSAAEWETQYRAVKARFDAWLGIEKGA